MTSNTKGNIEDILVEITQAEYDELHEELALKDSLIGDLQDELKKLRDKLVVMPNKGIVLGSEVFLREDSEYVRYNSHFNPLGVVGIVIDVREDDDEHPLQVKWGNSRSNAYHYRDLELA